MNSSLRLFSLSIRGALWLACAAAAQSAAAAEVRVSRFWHNHQPIYWPEWNSGAQNQRV